MIQSVWINIRFCFCLLFPFDVFLHLLPGIDAEKTKDGGKHVEKRRSTASVIASTNCHWNDWGIDGTGLFLFQAFLPIASGIPLTILQLRLILFRLRVQMLSAESVLNWNHWNYWRYSFEVYYKYFCCHLISGVTFIKRKKAPRLRSYVNPLFQGLKIFWKVDPRNSEVWGLFLRLKNVTPLI